MLGISVLTVYGIIGQRLSYCAGLAILESEVV